MDNIRRILENQQEVKYLTYFVYEEKTGTIKIELATLSISKNYKFRTVDGCLNKLVDILFELKKLENWMIKKEKI